MGLEMHGVLWVFDHHAEWKPLKNGGSTMRDVADK
jgi:hypothetical protein